MQRNVKDAVTELYDRALLGVELRHYDKIGFLNIGYWRGSDGSMEIAQINLIEKLVKFFYNTNGNILDVACGRGASSKYLTKVFSPEHITGIDIFEKHVDLCRLIAPECRFRVMDATRLEFGESEFDNVLCLEAALHFSTRLRFFEEVFRVLKPGGRLAMLDFLCDYDRLGRDGVSTMPRENYLPNLESYRAALASVGFRSVRIEDCTESTIRAGVNYAVEKLETEFGETGDVKILEEIQQSLRYAECLFAGAMVYAIK